MTNETVEQAYQRGREEAFAEAREAISVLNRENCHMKSDPEDRCYARAMALNAITRVSGHFHHGRRMVRVGPHDFKCAEESCGIHLSQG